MLINADQIQQMDRIKRLNLINAITGIKPANLIGTSSPEHGSNLAIFSSVVHLGSNPALLGFITRPTGEVSRNTLENIELTGHYTINHVPTHLAAQAHQTSAKYPKGQSEFALCGFSETYLADFPAPFVAEAGIKIGLKLAQQIPIELNQTRLVIGTVELIELDERWLSPEGYLDLQAAQTAGISGLNCYYRLIKQEAHPYARP
jgi:flavin reductase (DIM6/NTAB) family NADH-FMN oxidoreductase RutF